jgi:NhaP-type Na+/H+ or K+/H+ antiporter
MILPCNIASSVPNTTFSIFLPVIVSGLGYKGIRANLFSVPIYVIGAVGLWVMAYSSDRFKDRSYHILISLVFVFVGLIMVGQIKGSGGRYAALCILQIGSYTASPLTVSK